MAVKLGNGNWAVKEDKLLAYNDNSGLFFNKEFDFSRGSTATYVGRDGLIASAASDTPRIDFTNDTKGHLLLEPSRTNLLIQSVNLASIFTFNTGGGSLTANYGVSPDGSKTSTRVITNDTNNSHCFEILSGGSGSFTYSLYYKGIIGETTTIRAIAIGSGGVSAQKSITFTGKWQREQITFQRGASVNYVYIVDYRSINGTATDFQVFGGQVEEGSYPTSYIPTTGATSTRNADVCNNSGSAQDFNSKEGVLYAEIAALADDGTYRFISLSSGAYANSVRIGYFTTTNVVEFRVVSGGVNQGSLLYTLTDVTDIIKIAGRYKQNDFQLWVNGTNVVTDTIGNVPVGLNELAFDDGNTTNNSPFYGKVRNVQVFTEALTDEQLEKLTS